MATNISLSIPDDIEAFVPYDYYTDFTTHLYGHNHKKDTQIYDIDLCGNYMFAFVITHKVNAQYLLLDKYLAIKTFNIYTRVYNEYLLDQLYGDDININKIKTIIFNIQIICKYRIVFNYSYTKKSGIYTYNCKIGKLSYLVSNTHSHIVTTKTFSNNHAAILYLRSSNYWIIMIHHNEYKIYKLCITEYNASNPTSKYDFIYFKTYMRFTFNYHTKTISIGDKIYPCTIHTNYIVYYHNPIQCSIKDIQTLNTLYIINIMRDMYMYSLFINKDILSFVISEPKLSYSYVIYYNIHTHELHTYKLDMKPLNTRYNYKGDIKICNYIIKAQTVNSNMIYYKKSIKDELCYIGLP